MEWLAVPASAPAQDLPVDGESCDGSGFLFKQPLTDQSCEGARIDGGQYPAECGIAGRTQPARLIREASQSPQLALGELPAGILESAKPACAHQGGDGRTGQDKGLAVVKTVTTPLIG